jgi:hypothetical protein
MKKYVSILMMLGVTAAIASPTALITKSNHPGFVHPDFARGEKCEVFQDSVVITHEYGYGPGAVVTTEKRDFKLTGDITALIKKAASEVLEEKENGLCDGPSTFISAQGDVELFETGGCGSPRRERQGGAAYLLRDIVDQFCPVTHNIGVIEE